MRILFVSGETPFLPSGGIATYLHYAATALRAAGHDVFLFTWTYDAHDVAPPKGSQPFNDENTHIEYLDRDSMWRAMAVRYASMVLSTWLQDRILAVMQDWQIDVVETIDWQSPCLTLFQDLQTSSRGSQVLLSTFNHGHMDPFFEADQLSLSSAQQIDNMNERQQCRVSDIVIAPSEFAKARLNQLELKAPIEVVREPYEFRSEPDAFAGLSNKIEYMGRVSLSKGMDKLIYCANILDEVLPLATIRLIGRLIDPPFRTTSAKSYVTSRLHPRLRNRVEFSGFLDRDSMMTSLTPGAISPSLGHADTFSYACVEGIDAGHFPLVRQGTPMAEFYPPDLQDHLLKEDLGPPRALRADLERIFETADSLVPQITAHCRETLAPAVFAEELATCYARHLDQKLGRKHYSAVSSPMGVDDVTILIPAYRPDASFRETVDSICAQTTGVPNVIICADGAPDKDVVYFEYARARLPNLHYIEQRNSGLLAARNTLIEACTSKLAVFLDADDMIAPDFLKRGLAAFNESLSKPAAVLFQRQTFNENAHAVLHSHMDDHIHLIENEFRMTALIDVDVLREIGFPSDRRNGEADDWLFWVDFSLRDHRAVLVPETHFWYRFHENSMSWPWSEGQHVGTMVMLRDILLERAENNPKVAQRMARAMLAKSVRK